MAQPNDPLPHDALTHDALSHNERRARRPQTGNRLERSRHHRVLAGILGGIADYIGADPAAVRLIFVAATLLSGGILAIGYALLWLLLPLEGA